ncbi:hypothetical protein F1728_19690 [Gimesia benthica]|uniref:Uncharacterized protein n=1 Tax=Gimesia benthica TaxID=2608982 RepID=A0A6I6AH98_9PLAN|nr:DUF5676 family membrane protein [Gimesia benthica]QGQ24770.1 hypothetical protein F1728_19690 [Gimesia benthica]|tara:strand:+ start:7984 stop:8352 length:369 start_codon:yes stop_codon:yes gene_type:complete
MSTDIHQRNDRGSGNARPTSASRHTHSTPHLNPQYLGLAFGATGLVFYLGCMLMMATVPHDKVVIVFNSLLHDLGVGPILRISVPISQVSLGLVTTTFILGWFAGVLIAGIYNLSLSMRKWK